MIICILKHILDVTLEIIDPNSLVRIRLGNDHLKHSPICTSSTKRSQMTVQCWMMEVGRVSNLHEEFRLDDSVAISNFLHSIIDITYYIVQSVRKYVIYDRNNTVHYSKHLMNSTLIASVFLSEGYGIRAPSLITIGVRSAFFRT